jgi:hypothetical protein
MKFSSLPQIILISEVVKRLYTAASKMYGRASTVEVTHVEIVSLTGSLQQIALLVEGFQTTIRAYRERLTMHRVDVSARSEDPKGG